MTRKARVHITRYHASNPRSTPPVHRPYRMWP